VATTSRTAASPIVSPSTRHVLTIDRRSDFAAARAGTPRATLSSSRQDIYYRTRLGDLFGRVTESSLPAAGRRAQGPVLSASGDDRFVPRFSTYSQCVGSVCTLRPELLRRRRLSHGGFSAPFYERLGLADGAAAPEKKSRRRWPLGCTRHRACLLRMAAKEKISCPAGASR